jgi:hypothetical protein
LDNLDTDTLRNLGNLDNLNPNDFDLDLNNPNGLTFNMNTMNNMNMSGNMGMNGNMNMGGNMGMGMGMNGNMGLDLDMDMDDLSDEDILATSIGGMSNGSADHGQGQGHNQNQGQNQNQNHGRGQGQGQEGNRYNQSGGTIVSGVMDGIRGALGMSGPGYGTNDHDQRQNGSDGGGSGGGGTVNTSDLTGSMRGTPVGMVGFDPHRQQHALPPSYHQQQQPYPPAESQQQSQSQDQLPPPAPVPGPPGLSEEKARALEALLVRFWTRQMDLAERGSDGSSAGGGGVTFATGEGGDENGAGGTNTNISSGNGNANANGTQKEEFKNFALPLARIKKVMKSDPEVKMISAEVPVLLGKCCESEC